MSEWETYENEQKHSNLYRGIKTTEPKLSGKINK